MVMMTMATMTGDGGRYDGDGGRAVDDDDATTTAGDGGDE